MMRFLNYDQGGKTTPTPPAWIASDPNFANVRFIGKNKEEEFNRPQGQGGREFRFDLKGVKFYGFEDDGFTFIDENGNAFTAERDYSTGNPDDEGGGYDDMFNYLKDQGAVYSKEYEQMMKSFDKARGGRTFRYEQGGKTPQGGKFHKGGKKPFKMVGQYADPVESEMGPEGSREYVMYLTDDFKTKVKVYGNWNEYAAGRDENGRDYIMDEDYPIIVNERGEYVLDEPRFNEFMDNMAERAPVERMRNVTEYETQGQDNRTQSLLDKLNQARGPRRLPGPPRQ